MRYKKIMILAILLVSLLAVSAVSAADNATSDILSVDETTDEVVSIENGNQVILEENNNVGTFTELANEIANSNGELNLTKDYTYVADDSSYKNGIKIDKTIAINGNGFTISGNNQARIFNVTASNVVLNNICFENAFASNDGGAIHWSGENGILANCSFVNSFSSSSKDNHGGAVYWSGVSGVLANCSFVNSTVISSSGFGYSQGGAVYWSGADGVLVNCEFVNSLSHFSSSSGFGYSEGGAVYWDGFMGTLFNCSFVNSVSSSNADSIGGAVYWSGYVGALFNCSFVNSSSSGDTSTGGAISWLGYYSVLFNCSFVNSSSSGYSSSGGAVEWLGDTGILFNCSFVNSVSSSNADSTGGAVNWVGRNGTLSNCSFVNSSSFSDIFDDSYGDGGAVFWSGFKGVLTDCSFVNSSSSGYSSSGGAVYWNDANNGVLANCSFVNSSSSGYSSSGGAVYWDNANNGVLFNCSFVNSSVSSSFGSGYSHRGVGGAVYLMWSSNSVLANCSFVNSSVHCDDSYGYIGGGAVYWISGNNRVLANCSFVNSSVSSSSDDICGGAVYGGNYSSISVVNCSFVGNSAKMGGAACQITANNCYFANNIATEYGGALYNCSAEACIFDGNIAGIAGNDMYPSFVLIVPDFTSTYKSGDKLIINLTDDGIPVTDVEITIRIYKGDSIIGTYNCLSGDGWVVDLKPGNYTALISGNGVISTTANVIVNKVDMLISAVYDEANNRIVATLTSNASGKVIANANVNVNLNGVNSTVKSNSKGQVIVSTANLPYGAYTATISYPGNAIYYPASASIDFENKANMIISDIHGNASELTAILTNSINGNKIANANVVVNINGVITTVKSNGKGQIKVPIADLTGNTYTATISYKGNAIYNPVSTTTTINIDKANMIIAATYDAANKQIVGTLTNGNTGKNLQNVNIKVNLNGVTTTVKSNSKGNVIVSVSSLPVGTYTATFSYAGNSIYNPASTSIDFSTKAVMIISDIYGNANELTAILTNSLNGKKISNANVVVNINGVATTVKSNGKGQIKVPVTGLTGNTYTASISYKGNSIYDKVSTTATVNVDKANMIIATTYDAVNKQIVGNLTNDVNGKNIQNVNIKVNLNGVTTTVKSNGKGLVIVQTTGLGAGTYVASLSYPGNSIYNPSNTVVKVDV